MKYHCDICGSTSHPTEEHANQIEAEMEKKEKAPLSNAVDTLSRLDTTPSTPETMDFVSQPVEEWMKDSKDTWLKTTIMNEQKKHLTQKLDDLYSEAILKSMYGRLAQQELVRSKASSPEKQVAELLKKIDENELLRGYHRIWAKNLSRSEIETIYFNAVEDVKSKISVLEDKLRELDDKSEIDQSLMDLLHWRNNLYGIQSILLDWEQINDTNLSETRRPENDLAELLKRIDEIGGQVMDKFQNLDGFPQDEWLDREASYDHWHSVYNDWWVRPANWKADAEMEKYLNPKDNSKDKKGKK